MKIIQALAIVVCFCIAHIAMAQTDIEQPTGSLLWKISGNGLEQPSYIFGTHHLLPADYLKEIPGVEEAFSETDRMVGEIDMTNMESKIMLIVSASMMPPEDSYKNYLSEIEYNNLDSTLKVVLGSGLDQLGRVKPAAISNLLALKLYTNKNPEMDISKHIAMDMYLQTKAQKEEKPIIGLETAEDQIELLFTREPLNVQVENLACEIRNLKFQNKMFDSLNNYYKTGDLISLDRIYRYNEEDPCPKDGAYTDALNSERNQKWLLSLPDIMKEQSSFIAVGCLHLAGPEGLLFKLKLMGYTVEAVK